MAYQINTQAQLRLADAYEKTPQYILQVGMNGCEIAKFDEYRPCVGAWDLNGTIIVILVSDEAVIMANIAPREKFDPHDPPATNDAGLAARFMLLLDRKLENNALLFTKEKHPITVIFTPMTEKGDDLPEATNLLKDYLKLCMPGLEPIIKHYEVRFSNSPMGPGNAAVFVDGREQPPAIWLSDNRLEDPYKNVRIEGEARLIQARQMELRQYRAQQMEVAQAENWRRLEQLRDQGQSEYGS